MVVFVFFCLSIDKSIKANFFIESVMQLFQIVIPFVFAFVLLNTLSEKEIEQFMKVSFWMTDLLVILLQYLEIFNQFLIY